MATPISSPLGTAASTTTADFAQPIYLEDPAGSSIVGSSAASSDPLSSVVIDLDDPNLLMHEIDTNADTDAYAAPPPLPDGRWQVKIKHMDVKNAQGEPVKYTGKVDKNGQPYAFTALEATVVDPSGKFDGLRLNDYFVSTRQQRNGGVPVVRLLTCLKVQVPAKISVKILMEELVKALAAEPLMEVDTAWEGSPDQADQERFETAGEKLPKVMGQHRFPKGADGKALPDIEVDTKLGKVNLRARPRINAYFPLGSAQASGMTLGPKGK